MKIELRNVKINLAFSEETTMFKADVYVNGKKTAYAHNDGHGGSTFYNRYPSMEGVLKEAETYAKSLPSTTHTFGETTMTLESNLERIIDNEIDRLVNEKEAEKFKKKITKLMETNVVYGIPNSTKVAYMGFKGNPKLSILKGTTALNNLVARITAELKEGEIIFNKNI